MVPRSFALFSALAVFYNAVSVVSQAALASITQAPTFVGSAAADLQGPSASAVASCGACFLVADVAGLVWYSEVFLNTAATAVVGVNTVANGTVATRTSIIQGEGQFTFDPAAPQAPGALTQVNYDPTVSIAGAILTSPTAYNVFTAYAITSEYLSDGICVTTTESRTSLSSAYSEVLTAASGAVYLDQSGEQSFINFLGFTSCSGAGVNVAATALVQVTNTTATSTTTFSGIAVAASVSLAISNPASVAATTTPTTLASSTSSTSSTPSISISAQVPNIVIGNTTITPSPNPVGLPIFTAANGTTTFVPADTLIPFTGNGNLSNGGAVPFPGIATSRTAGVERILIFWISMMSVLGIGIYLL